MALANLLARGTALAALDRLPGWVDELWARVHRVEGGCVLASGLFVRSFGESLDRLGLAEIARSGIVRCQGAIEPGDAARLRYHVCAFFGHLGAFAAEVRAFAAAFGPETAAALEAKRGLLKLVDRLAAEAAHPRTLRIAPEDRAAHTPATDPDEVALSEAGVDGAGAVKRAWTPIPDLATALSADAAVLLEAVARAAMARIDAGGEVALDLRVERGG